MHFLQDSKLPNRTFLQDFNRLWGGTMKSNGKVDFCTTCRKETGVSEETSVTGQATETGS